MRCRIVENAAAVLMAQPPMLAYVAAIVAHPLARLTQERVTTLPDLRGVSLGTLHRAEQGGLVVHRVAVQRS